VNAEVLELIAQFADAPADPAQPLELTSLELVQLAEALEARFDFVVAARELTRENFASAARIDAFVARKRGGR
jgi:acyl carrier protein